MTQCPGRLAAAMSQGHVTRYCAVCLSLRMTSSSDVVASSSSAHSDSSLVVRRGQWSNSLTAAAPTFHGLIVREG